MSRFDPTQLWENIVAATAETGARTTVFRIPLFVTLQGERATVLQQLKEIYLLCTQLVPRSGGPLPSASKGKVLFCFPHNTPSNMNNLLPVAREAQDRGILGGILAHERCLPNLTEFSGKVPMVTDQELVGQIRTSELVTATRNMFRDYRQTTTNLLKRHRDLTPQVASYWGTRLRTIITAVQLGLACERMLDIWSPSCLISTSDFWPLEHQLCCESSKRQIPSLVIQHGVINNFWWPFVADRYYVWGELYANQMREIGTPSDRLLVAGMPATDQAFTKAKETTKRAAGDDPRAVCLILSHTHGSVFEPEVWEGFRSFLT